MYRFGNGAAKSFFMPERGLKSFVMPYVQRYLVTPLFVAREGEGWCYRLVNFRCGGEFRRMTRSLEFDPNSSSNKRQRGTVLALKHIKEKPRPGCYI
jgi:hypothetical protein